MKGKAHGMAATTLPDVSEYISGRAAQRLLGMAQTTWEGQRYRLPVRRLEVPGCRTRWHRGDLEALLMAAEKSPKAEGGQP